MKLGIDRKKGGGRKILDVTMEKELAQWWINEVKQKKATISLSIIK